MNIINKEWHLGHKMPENASREQRAVWHIEHLKNCGCREPTPGVQELIDEYNAAHGDGGTVPA